MLVVVYRRCETATLPLDCWIVEDGTDRMSRNVGKNYQHNAAWQPRRAKTSPFLKLASEDGLSAHSALPFCNWLPPVVTELQLKFRPILRAWYTQGYKGRSSGPRAYLFLLMFLPYPYGGVFTCIIFSPRVVSQKPKYLTLRWLMSYIYGAPILDVSRSHTTTQHSR